MQKAIRRSHRKLPLEKSKGNDSKVNKGFALISTIIIMSLLLMVSLGMLSMSATELKTSRVSDNQEEAKANAKMALMIAIGELQRTMGPDQRVDAQASIFDTNPETEQIDGVKNPYWMVAYDTRWSDGTSLYVRNVNQGGERDKRFPSGDAAQWQRETRMKAALVSGNEGLDPSSDQFLNPLTADLSATNADGIEMVKMNYPEGDPRRVWAKRVKLNEDGREAGGYAWFVRPLSLSAKTNIKDAYDGKQADPNNPNDGGYARLLAASHVPASSVNSVFNSPIQTLTKLINLQQYELVSEDAKLALQDHWWDMTAHGYGVQVNVRTGKLKRNLSEYLNATSGGSSGGASISPLTDSSTTLSPGLSDDDYLVGIANAPTLEWYGKAKDSISWAAVISKREKTAPRYAALRKFAQLGQTTPFIGANLNQVYTEAEPSPNHATGPFDGHNRVSINLNKNSTQDLRPILTEATNYYNISYFRTSSGKLDTSDNTSVYRLRVHYYPRVTLWNPYNVAIKVDRMSIMMQMPGKRYINVSTGSEDRWARMILGTSGGVMEGSMFFITERATIQPGECLVLSPSANSRFYLNSPASMLLVPNRLPDPSRSYYHDASSGGFEGGSVTVGGKQYHRYDFPSPPTNWAQSGGNSAQDVRILLKKNASSVNNFISSPLVCGVSGSPKLGGGVEQPLSWSNLTRVSMDESNSSGVSNQKPDRRTRESVRLRWADEPDTNITNSGLGGADANKLFSTPTFAQWNPRADFILKSAYDNTARLAPYFHGLYSRDIGGPESSWDANAPRFISGQAHGNPFGHHQDGVDKNIFFDVPREDIGVVSLAQLGHAKLSQFAWHPSYPIGNSWADMRCGRNETVPQNGGSNLGWNARSYGSEYVAQFGRGWIQHTCASEHVIYDLSFNLNHQLYDDYFLTALSGSDLESFLSDPLANPLPNSRLKLLGNNGSELTTDDLGFHKGGKYLVVDGAFNVNSTSVKAWKAVLSATQNSGTGEYVFPRVLHTGVGAYKTGENPLSEEALAGYRELSESDIEELAEKIVVQVKKRGPFLSMSDFVNRRLVKDETGLMGALQAAIDDTQINEAFRDSHGIDRSAIGSWGVSGPEFNISDGSQLTQEHKADSKLAGLPGYLTQADLLQSIGGTLTARSDCFMIRTYGEVKNAQGIVVAKAWCEAIVQRTPEPINPVSKTHRLNPKIDTDKPDFGRKFRIVSFRWLSKDEI